MSIARLKSIKQHWLENGLCPRGRPKVLPHNNTNLSDIKNAVRYILQYAEDHAILLPGRIPRYKRDDFQLLPSSITKREVWHLYHSAASTGADTKAVGYSLFCALWRKLIVQAFYEEFWVNLGQIATQAFSTVSYTEKCPL